MSNPSIPFPYLPYGEASSPKTGENFDSLVKYLSDLNSGTTSWDYVTSSGPIKIPDGTVSAPGLAFAASGNTDNGIYRIGTDNWAMAAAGAKVWETSASGAITQPLQPCFLVRYTNAANVTGDGTAYTVAFDSEVFDVGSNFATNTFTAPITGKYMLSAMVAVTGMTAGMTYYEVRIVTSNRSYIIDFGNQGSVGAGYAAGNLSVVADMDAGDTAYVVLDIGGGSKVADTSGGTTSYFCGSLLN